MLLNSRRWPLILPIIILGIFKTKAYFGPIMKNLIIHPEDPTTTFLSQIYANLNSKTVIRGGVSKSELQELIESHDRVLMLGHGSPWGLLNTGQYPDACSYIIDDSMALTLKNKVNSLFIWCLADQFVQRHGLSGFYSGMFISEVEEAFYYGFDDADWNMIDQSNDRFASVVSKYINEPMESLYQKLLIEYGFMARTNPIARFNLDRLYLTSPRNNPSNERFQVISVPY
jgi:hypothetical protein